MKPRYWLAWIAVLYGFALFMPASRSSGGMGGEIPGYVCLIFVPVVCLFPAWWANPILLVGCGNLAAGNGRRARTLGVVASILAFSIFPMVGFDGVGPGAIVWATCPVILALAGHREGRAKACKPGGPGDWMLD